MSAQNACPLCAATSSLLAEGVEDYFFGFPGRWDYRQCDAAGCGVAFPTPRPDEATLAQAYGTYYTHESAEGGSSWLGRLGPPALGLRRPAVARRPGLPLLGWIAEQYGWDGAGVAPPEGGTAVDIGAGDGSRLARLLQDGWTRVIGIEPDAAAIETGRAAGLDLRPGAAEHVPLDDGEADTAILHHVIEHVDAPRVALAEALRILKPGGKLTIITPNIDSATRRRWGRHWRGFEAPRHLVIFTVDALVGLVRDAGFEVDVARTSGRSAAWMDAVSAKAAGVQGARRGRIGKLLDADRAYRAQQREIDAGSHVGDEIVLLAHKPRAR